MDDLRPCILVGRVKYFPSRLSVKQRDARSIRWLVVLLIPLLFALSMAGGAKAYAQEEDSPLGAGFSAGTGSPDSPANLSDVADLQGTPDAVQATPPVIDVWYGTQQVLGQNGIPQRWVNILGKASDPDGLNTLRYSLNGGAKKLLSIGPDGRRLAALGDFNIDIAYADLLPGLNTVVITATDTLGAQRIETVTIQYVDGEVWSNPYAIDWSSVDNIQDVAQVVDGLWTLEADSVRSSAYGYDRLIAIGDVAWDDYEVTVPITAHSKHSLSLSGVGFLLRWSGHTDDPISGWQPKTGWRPYGAIGWYTWQRTAPAGRLQIWGNDDQVIAEDTSGWQLALNTPYIFKMRVETGLGQYGIYSFKVWEEGQDEPAEWDLVGIQTWPEPQNGSLLLLAHQVDASFGDVMIVPLATTLELNTVGEGSVDPPQGSHVYDFGDEVLLSAEPALGWSFSGWSGDHISEDNPTTVVMDANKTVTATFTQDEYDVEVSIEGQGQVAHTPGNSYYYGQEATLQPIPETYWHFVGWSGPDVGDLAENGDGTWSLLMNGDKAVTATFAREQHTLTVENTIGNGLVDPPVGDHVYYYGEVITLTVAPDLGWQFEDWLGTNAGDLVELQGSTWSLFIDGDKAVQARFKQEEYQVTVVYTGQGSVAHTPGNPYFYGQTARLEPIPALGWRFDEWRGDDAAGLVDNGDGSWSLTVDGDKELTAVFSTHRSLLPLILQPR